MAEEIRDLIEKIQKDGISSAEEKARAIEGAARQQADETLQKAQRQADEMIAAATERIRREDEKEKTLLAQAGRDLLLSLRREINAMLARIVIAEVREALTPETLSMLISEAVRNYSGGERGDITVYLKKNDLEILENHFLSRLSGETKKKIVLKPSEDVTGGFTISYDEGRSCHDFSDKALAGYIGTCLKPKLDRILRDVVRE